MTVSLIIETWNIDGDVTTLRRLLGRLAAQAAACAAEVIITHEGIAGAARAALAAAVDRPITWVELAPSAGYYDHKNAGFDASSGDIVAFLDGDCEPALTWLACLLAPFAGGARVVAGATSYAGTLAPLATELDFPYFRGSRPQTVRNFFANNVAFARDVFASRRYPTLAPMFHGQCQVLALRLAEADIPIRYARAARVTHAWPASVSEWLEVRLLRGADTTQLLPHVLATYAPRIGRTAKRLGPLPALAVLGYRALTGTWSALRRGPVLRGLALVAGVTAIDALGAAAAPAVYRWIR